MFGYGQSDAPTQPEFTVIVTPAQAGVQGRVPRRWPWMPAFASMTETPQSNTQTFATRHWSAKGIGCVLETEFDPARGFCRQVAVAGEGP